MRKRVGKAGGQDTASDDNKWLDLESIAEVEVTSEDPEFPIESAMIAGESQGWLAAAPGPQTILLKFDAPQRFTRIMLRFVEGAQERTQEFSLSWSTDGGRSFREIVRQRWNFSPSGSTSEAEDYRVDLANVTALKLVIDPDLGRNVARAGLARLRLA
ncbi:MAG TPA: carbohydrate-binding protein [Terriglobia bacterium]|nr:carbohydrate-binding protein [Terriglobia bacterium]